MESSGRNSDRLIRDHRRQWRDNLYVYPVIARRSKGVSIGVNLNPDRRCTFGCVYCQVDRRVSRNLDHVDLTTLHAELTTVCRSVLDGELWLDDRFRHTPQTMRRINDIAFSGDGEPTCLPEFDRAVGIAADVRRQLAMEAVKIVVITNATQLGSPQMLRALPILDANNGEIWAKLDAGSEDYFLAVNHPHPAVTLESIVAGIADIARGRPVVIQTLFMNLRGQAPPEGEIAAYCGRLNDILARGGRIKLVQLHTVARPPAMSYVTALENEVLEAIARRVRQACPALTIETFPGAAKP